MPFNDAARQCKAKTREGKQCRNPALRGQDYCRHHAKAEPETNTWRDGPHSLQLVSSEEQELLDFALDSIERDFELNNSSDRMQAEMAAFYFVKWRAAVMADDQALQLQCEDLFRKNLGCLKATRDKRGDVEKEVKSPCELAVALLDENPEDNEAANSEESKKKVADVIE